MRRCQTPRLRRADWCSLNGSCRFAFDHDAAWKLPRNVDDWPFRIEVPCPPECEASGVGDTGFHRAFWYQLGFVCTSDGRRVPLRFGAVDFAARVWINDQLVATHEGGHTPFMADNTDQLSPTGQQAVTVAVHDDPHDLTQPRGKQDWQLDAHGIWYPSPEAATSTRMYVASARAIDVGHVA